MKLGGNMKNIMKQMGKMKEQMERLQNEAGEKTVEASSGGGMVTVTAKAKGEISSIVIEPEIISETDIEMLQDLVDRRRERGSLQGPGAYERGSLAYYVRHGASAGAYLRCEEPAFPSRSQDS